MNNQRQRTISGILWNFTEKFFMRLGQFVISIVLARLLLPADFGLIAIIMFFVSLSQVFVESGFAQALIQKKERTTLDYTSVFTLNLVVSIVLYIVLFVAAPFISSFYCESQLVSLIRVLSLILIINSLVVVQNVMLQVAVDFKKLAKINVTSVLFSGGVGVICAHYGLGVWALVIQSLVRSFLNFLLFTYYVKWHISFKFSLSNLRGLWPFASNLFVAGIVSELSNNIYSLLIGKYFSVKSLGYYQRANNFTVLASDTVTQAIMQVSFPVLSQMQDDKDRMVGAYIKIMKMSAFVIFPVMAMLSVMAEPIVRILLNDEWLPVIPLLRLMTFTRFLYPLFALNLNILKVTGRSDLFLKVDLATLPTMLIVLLITLPLGIKALIIGQIICIPFSYVIYTIVPGRFYDYGFFKQLRDVLPFCLATVLLYLAASLCVSKIESSYLQLLLGGSVGILVYLTTCKLLKNRELQEVLTIVSNVIFRRK